LRLFSFGGYGLALAALALVVFGADSYPDVLHKLEGGGSKEKSEKGVRKGLSHYF